MAENVMEQHEAVSRNALVGWEGYKDGSSLPAIFLDLSKDTVHEGRIKELFNKDAFKKFDLHIEDGETVFIESIQDFLDGSKLENFAIRFKPDIPDDIDAFMGMLDFTNAWTLVIRLSESEMHMVVAAESDDVMYKYESPHMSNVKTFPREG